jgi:ubiquinone/menaquinone biosynthesis C-methylase UbiE
MIPNHPHTVSIYHSSTADKSAIEAKEYSKTHDSSHRYLAYRDLSLLLEKYLSSREGKLALDYGAGTGYSTDYLSRLGLESVGVDVSQEMLRQAEVAYPHLSFYEAVNGKIPFEEGSFDVLFSSFVLFELANKQELMEYLSESRRVLRKDGLFIALTGSQYLHSTQRKWLNFSSQFSQNEELSSGKEVKLLLNELEMEFTDYYWSERDYVDFFSEADFTVETLHYPLGTTEEPYGWHDELFYSPYLILVAKPKA